MKSFGLFTFACLFLAVSIGNPQDTIQSRSAPSQSFCSTPGSTCNLTAQGDVQHATFKTHLNNLNVTGVTSNQNSIVHTSLSIHIDGTPEISFTGTLVNGTYTATFEYGPKLGGVHNLTLTTQSGNSIVGAANNARIRSFTGAVALFTFANGTAVPPPRVPEAIAFDLQQLPDVAKAAVRNCKSAQNVQIQQRSHPALAPRQNQNPFEIPPGFDDTNGAVRCLACTAEAFAAEVGCSIACAASLGFACACFLAIPFAYINCHNPGTGFTQGCCPVACGPITDELGISTVDQCCFAADTCAGLDIGTAACCAAGLQPCGGRTCCPSNAPCRDLGICCPTDRDVCATSSGPACCNEGEDCVQGVCCPRASQVNGQCCLPSSQTCCPSRTPSRCAKDSLQHCVDNLWVSSPCVAPQECIAIPVAGAGVACECPPPRPGAPFCCNPQDSGCCLAGTPSRCGQDSIQRCVSNRWVDEPCLPPLFCLAIPVAGAGVSCSGVGRN